MSTNPSSGLAGSGSIAVIFSIDNLLRLGYFSNSLPYSKTLGIFLFLLIVSFRCTPSFFPGYVQLSILDAGDSFSYPLFGCSTSSAEPLTSNEPAFSFYNASTLGYSTLEQLFFLKCPRDRHYGIMANEPSPSRQIFR